MTHPHSPTVGTLPDGTRGFDCNTHVTLGDARRFRVAGYRFAVRYVRRSAAHDYDITTGEMAALLGAGLGVMLVQHVAPPDWLPTTGLGVEYGSVAAEEARKVGYLKGATLWCDLEEVSRLADTEDVIGYCNGWYDGARAGGYSPGLYVGYRCGLTPEQLYRRLRFARYWSAYNLNRDEYPAVRGVQMQQRPYPGAASLPSVGFEYDVNILAHDLRGSTPSLLLP